MPEQHTQIKRNNYFLGRFKGYSTVIGHAGRTGGSEHVERWTRVYDP